jgi:hypothetical protein
MNNRSPIQFSRRSVVVATAVVALTTRSVDAQDQAMGNVVLLGDSVFDNGAYVKGGPDVVAQLRQKLSTGWTAHLLAVDGSVMADVLRQIERLPSGATHLIISMGGNDALQESAILNEPSQSVAESLLKLSDIHERFCSEYGDTLDAILRRQLPTAVCTIYDVRYPDHTQRQIAKMALSVINDCIIREAVARGVPIIDLRLVCDDDADFANAIEPSERGGEKIAAAIVSVLSKHEFSRARSEMFGS